MPMQRILQHAKYIILTAYAVGVRILLLLGSRKTTPIHILTRYGSLEEFNMQHRNLQQNFSLQKKVIVIFKVRW
jgi:hypothetical protein